MARPKSTGFVFVMISDAVLDGIRYLGRNIYRLTNKQTYERLKMTGKLRPLYVGKDSGGHKISRPLKDGGIRHKLQQKIEVNL